MHLRSLAYHPFTAILRCPSMFAISLLISAETALVHPLCVVSKWSPVSKHIEKEIFDEVNYTANFPHDNVFILK